MVFQIRRDQQPPPTFVARTGITVRVGRVTGDTSARRCRPAREDLETELVSLGRVSFDPALPICDLSQPGPYVLDEWGGGRILWRPRVALEIERW